MKIRVFSPLIPYPPTESSTQIIWEQIEVLVELGHTVELVCWHTKSRHIALSNEKLKNFRFKFFGDYKVNESTISKIYRKLVCYFRGVATQEEFWYPPRAQRLFSRSEPEQFDLGIYHSVLAFNWLKLARKSEKKQVVHIHQIESDFFSEQLNKSSIDKDLLFKHEGDVFKFVDEAWVTSEPDLEYFKSRGPTKDGLRLVPPSFSAKIFTQRTKAFLNSEIDQNFSVGFIGESDPAKNFLCVRWLIEKLAPELEKRNFEGELIIVGTHSDLGLKEAAKRFKFVKMPGTIDDKESLLEKLSFILIPQFVGSGVQIQLIEALASGIPVLATRHATAQVSKRLQDLPSLFTSDRSEEWADYLLQQEPFLKRVKFSESKFPDGLDSIQVYDFLKNI